MEELVTEYADLGDLAEDMRIDMIGRAVVEQQRSVAFIVDDEPGKAERYIKKLQEKFPNKIRVIARGKGPVAETQFVKVGPEVV